MNDQDEKILRVCPGTAFAPPQCRHCMAVLDQLVESGQWWSNLLFGNIGQYGSSGHGEYQAEYLKD